MTSLVESAFTAEHRRGHGAMRDAVNHGRPKPRRLCGLLASTPLPRAADGRIVLTVDVGNWPRPDAPTSPESLFCHVHGRCRGADQDIPGRPCSLVAALETGRPSRTAAQDAMRVGTSDDATAVTAAQPREVVTRLVHARQCGLATRTSSSSWTPATTSPASPSSWPTCPSNRSAGCARTGSCSGIPVRAAPPPRGGQPRKHGGVLRRFDRELTFRLFEQTLGWTVPEARAPDLARN
ncbi:transposase [Streptomyces parvus]|uniref:transposase n=1 Tax=Streptomyces parvus TaxID=66428 RepID=UPI003D756B2A